MRALILTVLVLAFVGAWGQSESDFPSNEPEALKAAKLAIDDGRYDEAFKLLKPLAHAGNADAQTGLGFLLSRGLGVATDLEAAHDWFSKAADQGFPLGIFNLARCYAEGAGVPRDCEKALQLYIRSAQTGDPKRQVDLGAMYAEGAPCVERDLSRALHWYRSAAAQNDPVAQHNLAVMYAIGQGVDANPKEALRWYERAADQGYGPSQLMVGHMYLSGQGADSDPATAARYYRHAAAQGNAEAQTYLGFLYENGLGVPKDIDQAVDWYSRAVESGYIGAFGRLAANITEVTADTKERARASIRLMPDIAMAKALHGSTSFLSVLELVEHGIAVDLGGVMVDKSNVAEFKDLAERQLSLCRGEAERREADRIVGTYRAEATPDCTSAKSAWVSGICEQVPTEVEILQEGCEATLTYNYKLQDDDVPIEVPVWIVGSALAFEDMSNSDYVFVGVVQEGTIRIRPDTEAVLDAWPPWADPPERRSLEGCEVVLTAASH